MSSEARYRSAGRRPYGAILSRALLLALAFAAFTACGKQGPPLPPFRVVPAPTKDLAARQQGGQILLSFGYPQASASGTALGGITKVELYEATRPVSPTAGDKVEPLDARLFTSMAKVRLTLEGPDLVSATSGDRLNIALPLPTAATGAAMPASYFAVKTTGKEGNTSEYSNVVSLLPKAPPAAPERVVVTARADGVQVEWSAVEGAAAGYNVYRRAASSRAAGQPVHQASGLERSWLDTSAKFGESYIYAVTAVSQREPILESPVTSEREVRYTDRFAPDAPKELVALAEPKQVRLVWRGSDATDVAGYLVFRRIGDQGAFQKISPQLLASPEMIDGDVTGGRAYTYRVVAVDQAGNESEPSAEARATIP